MDETMVCLKCGKEFKESEIVLIPSQEYVGSSVNMDDVSPCCNWIYTDKE